MDPKDLFPANLLDGKCLVIIIIIIVFIIIIIGIVIIIIVVIVLFKPRGFLYMNCAGRINRFFLFTFISLMWTLDFY